jgi:hypothetical protein
MLSPKQIFGSTFLVPKGKFPPKHVEQWDHPRDRKEYLVEIYTFKATEVGEGGGGGGERAGGKGFNCSIRTIFDIRDNRRMKVAQ